MTKTNLHIAHNILKTAETQGWRFQELVQVTNLAQTPPQVVIYLLCITPQGEYKGFEYELPYGENFRPMTIKEKTYKCFKYGNDVPDLSMFWGEIE